MLDFLSVVGTWIFSVSALVVLGQFIYEWLQRPHSISGKHIVVTGGSSGIGKSVAISAAKRGAHVTIIARNTKRLEETTQEITKAVVDSSQKVQYLSLDLSSDYAAVEKALWTLEEETAPIYMLVNCAGGAVCGKLEDTSANDIQNQLSMNFVGTVFPTKALIARMKSRGEGVVVVTGSVASLFGIYGFSIYSSTKFALRGFAEALHMETKPYGVSVTLAFPPDTDTPGFANEQKTKPMETRLISESGGLVQPEVVAEKILSDALRGRFFSSVGLEGGIVCAVAAGMSPPSSYASLAVEVLLMGPLRLVAACLLVHFNRIVEKCKHDRNKNKKLE
ncbi:3-ketodihydrosphingosine reductase [Thrips palmi]|uniref:3-dehydrosphinganine reductase n=1 Tax=Thrips palmi TaxID=161013 RepID=A0A6P8ZY08_THRPL|nr:3-ketodihydrosphingosine reductase [Thrips palmi]